MKILILKKNTKVFLVMTSMLLLNSACGVEKNTMPLELTGYNHTEKEIVNFSVAIGPHSPIGAGYLGPGQGGGGSTCCISLPVQWVPGMNLQIEFVTEEKGIARNKMKKIVLPKYDSSGVAFLNVHFLHNGNIKAFATGYNLWHSKYPLQGKEAEMKPGVPIRPYAK